MAGDSLAHRVSGAVRTVWRVACRFFSWHALRQAVGLVFGPHPVSAALRNRWSRAPVTGDAPVVVCMATYGSRLEQAHLALETIARGTVLPRRLILWTREDVRPQSLTPQLRRLMARGLEVCHAPDYGPHVKYYPYVESVEHHRLPLVTADDDALYPKWWLERLVAEHRAHPDDVIAYRAHLMLLEEGTIEPYAQWSSPGDDEPSARVFATGRCGVLYPPALLDRLREAGTAFLDCAPWADDVWLHAVELRSGVRVRPMSPMGTNFPVVPGALLDGLSVRNVLRGGNDEQIADTYTADDIAKLWRDQCEAAERGRA